MKKIKISKDKLRDVLLVACLAFLLVFAVWKIFYIPDRATKSGMQKTSSVTVANATNALFSGATSPTEKEESLAAFLSLMDGVGSAEVKICESSEGVISVAVLCDGAKNILVNMNVSEAVSASLGVEKTQVKIYQKKKLT